MKIENLIEMHKNAELKSIKEKRCIKVHSGSYYYKGWKITNDGGTEYPWNIKRPSEMGSEGYCKSKREAINEIDGIISEILYVENNRVECLDKTIEHIDIPDGVEYIVQNSFANCINLKSITIPASITLISSYAFVGCDNLKELDYNGTKEDWEKVRGAKDLDIPVRFIA